MARFPRSVRRLLIGVGTVALIAAACSGSGNGGAKAAGPNSGPELTGATSAPAGLSGATGPADGGATVVDVPAVPPSIVKNARLSLEVDKGGFEKAADQATTIAGEQGGYVESSSSQGSDVRSGRLTLRVPAANFETALADVSQIGHIRLRSVSGKDVTSRFVDLDARIRNARAQETVLLGILKQATTVTATLQVQRTLSDVQLQIEELVGQERSLQNRADLGTIVLDLFEVGGPVRHAVVQAGPSNPQLSQAWVRAKATFFGLLYGIVVSAGVLVPLGLAVLVGLVVSRRVKGRRLRPEPQPEA
jgi:Domain of unknown function (DUF4349)